MRWLIGLRLLVFVLLLNKSTAHADTVGQAGVEETVDSVKDGDSDGLAAVDITSTDEGQKHQDTSEHKTGMDQGEDASDLIGTLTDTMDWEAAEKTKLKMKQRSSRRMASDNDDKSQKRSSRKCTGPTSKCIGERTRLKRQQIHEKIAKCRQENSSKGCRGKQKSRHVKNRRKSTPKRERKGRRKGRRKSTRVNKRRRKGRRKPRKKKGRKGRKRKGGKRRKGKKKGRKGKKKKKRRRRKKPVKKKKGRRRRKKKKTRDHTQNGKYRENRNFVGWGKQINKYMKKVKKDSSCDCGVPNNENRKNNRIVNGEESVANSRPWMVSIQDQSGSWYCGGSVISTDWVLTAAHCVHYNGVTDNPKGIYLNIGDHDVADSSDSRNAKVIQASKVIVHDAYNEKTTMNDIALIKFSQSVDFSKFKGNVRPICLPEAPRKYYGDEVIVAGWGLLKDGGAAATRLREVKLKMIWMEQCRKEFKYSPSMIGGKMLCTFAEGKDACQGDSGGPLIRWNVSRNAYEQVGVVSWGIGCAEKNYPGVFVKLSHFIHWILRHIKGTTICDGN